ncbi:MAG: 7-cyano-7-deazaguanine synthase [Acidobacteria bacterium]|nr:7-cyano-7-deazaguanine synthase [Acidobacteriota bacterium]
MTSAVLFSGGLDSAVLLADEAARSDVVWPIHVRTGMAWEPAEARAIERLLSSAPFAARTRPLAALTVDMREVYPATHWAIEGRAPAYDTPDEDVYLEGRNIVLIAKAAVLCARLGAGRLVLGPLAGNPFPDATPEFFRTMAAAMSLGLGRPLEIAAPFSRLHKEDVVRLGVELRVPLELTLSCMQPAGERHCGRCSKCRERQDAFRVAGVADPTDYAAVWTGASHTDDRST